MKKLIHLIITLSMLLNCTVIPAHANNNITVELNGEEIYFDQPPIIQDGRTLVPMRAIFEAMDCEVVWHDNLQQIVVWKNGELLMNLEIGRKTMNLFDLGEKELDVPPQIINDRTLVPLRAISESVGATVEWNGSTQKISIKYTPIYNDDSDYDINDDESYINDNTENDDEPVIEEKDSSEINEIFTDSNIIEF